ncbi:MAG: D-glycerate dehydrogenase [Candidatus Cloacimonetes bacterium]|nr:D-glycerate dehydrogenase [Candidatus Cloacimonadota bacterium]
MLKPAIYVTRLLPEVVMDRLREYFMVRVNPHDRVLTRKEIMKNAASCDILLCLLTDTIDGEIMDVIPNLLGISNYAVGYDNIDIKAANARKIPVCNTPGVLTETTADLTWALILSVSRRIVEADRYTRTGRFKGWAPLLMLGQDVYGKTLGIIGAGRIGRAVARRARGFNMRLLYHDQQRNSELEKDSGAIFCSLPDLLSAADFVSLHIPLHRDTVNYISAGELQTMKRSAFLINTSRGQIVDETALLRALQKKWIAGAALDVYYNEPALTPGLTACNNLVMVPHIGSASTETRTRMGLMAADNAVAIMENRKPAALVNPEIWDCRRSIRS